MPKRGYRTMAPLTCVAAAVAAGPLAAGAGAAEPFTEEAVARGLVYTVQQQINFGCGLAFADLDNDGDPDLVVLGRTTLGAGDTTTIGFFENDGTGHFTDRSNDSGCPPLPKATGVTAADFDGDGDLDVHITNWIEPDVLLRNDGDFQFVNVALALGVANTGAGSGCGWGDYDGDTWLDLYVANRTMTSDLDPPYPYASELNALYHNLGGSSGFVDVAEALGVEASVPGFGPDGRTPLTGDRSFQGSFFDYDNDGDADLYLSNDKGLSSQENGPCTWQNRMWENQGGTFTDISASSGTDGCMDAMTVTIGDFDGNLYQDLYITNLDGTGPPATNGTNALYLNNGDGTFTESAELWGVDAVTPTAGDETCWGAVFFDYDNDGYLELYVCNLYSIVTNRLFNYDGTLPATDVASDLHVADIGKSYTCAVADIDDDGDVDLALSDTGVPGSPGSAPVRLFINHEGELRTWVKFDVVGEGGNLFAVGAQVKVRTGTKWQMREVIAGENFKSQNDLTMHFGLDAAEVVDEIVVNWPGGGTSRTLTSYDAGHTWTLYPPSRLGDADGDGTVGPDDFAALAGCFGLPVTPGCEVMDMNGDGAVDGGDVPGFLAAYDEPLEDCNDNGVADLEDILLGTSSDLNGDTVPDECVAADINQDGFVDVNDLVAVITAWGPCPGCPEDVNGDGFVDVNDLVEVILNWG